MASATFVPAGVPRVNLMPPPEIERRKRASPVRGWTWAVFAAILVAVAIIAGAFALKFVADQALVAEQANSNVLITELASLSEVSGALATESELTAFRGDAMAADFAWAPVVATITGALPADAVFIGDGAERYRGLLTEMRRLGASVLAPAIARLGWRLAANGQYPPHALQPLYVRRPDAERALRP